MIPNESSAAIHSNPNEEYVYIASRQGLNRSAARVVFRQVESLARAQDRLVTSGRNWWFSFEWRHWCVVPAAKPGHSSAKHFFFDLLFSF